MPLTPRAAPALPPWQTCCLHCLLCSAPPALTPACTPARCLLRRTPGEGLDEAGGGERSPSIPACAACTPSLAGRHAAGSCHLRTWGREPRVWRWPAVGAGSRGRQRAWGRPGERLSAFQTCPWKRSGPSRLRCKWPQTKSWGVSTPKPRRVGSPAARCLQGTETPDPAPLPAGGCRQGGLCTVHTEPPLHPVAEGSPPPGCPPHASPACAVCLSLPCCWLGWCRSGGLAALPSVPLPVPLPVPSPCPFAGTQLWGEPVCGVQAAPG